MRLDKYISDITVYSRSDVKKLLKERLVEVDGTIITDGGFKVDFNNQIKLNGEQLIYNEHEYLLLNKPAGYLSATFDNHQPTVMDLINENRKDLAIVGRLDKDTEGALMLTTDGELNHKLTSPKYHISKKYYVQVDKPLPDKAKEILEAPMDLGDFISEEAVFEKINDTECYLTIYEGKYHEVKRMFEKIGCTVTYLERKEFYFLTLKGLNRGEYRRLTAQEIEQMKKL